MIAVIIELQARNIPMGEKANVIAYVNTNEKNLERKFY